MSSTLREHFLKNRRMFLQLFWLTATCAFLLATMLRADNKVMGELELQGKSKVEKTSGVWVDGQYVGYLKELKGDKKLLLLPGEHEISVRQNGYQNFTQRITIRPGQKLVIPVAMEKGPSGALPAAWAIVKINVAPSRAAVFLTVQPIAGALLGVAFLHESLTVFTLAGGALIVLGLWLTARGQG